MKFSYSLKTWASGLVPDTWPGPAEPEARARDCVEAATRGLCRSPSCQRPDSHSSAGARSPASVGHVNACDMWTRLRVWKARECHGRQQEAELGRTGARHLPGGQQPPGDTVQTACSLEDTFLIFRGFFNWKKKSKISEYIAHRG